MEMKWLHAQMPVEQFLANYVDVPKFLHACSQCPNYGKIGSCPPYDFDVLEYWRGFQTLQLTAVQGFIAPEERNIEYSTEALNAQVAKHFAVLRREMDARLEIQEQQTPQSRMLSAGKCLRCADCACAHGLPCRFPEQLRYSIESLGGDVGGLLRDLFGVNLLWAENGHLPEYFVLAGGLLTK